MSNENRRTTLAFPSRKLCCIDGEEKTSFLNDFQLIKKSIETDEENLDRFLKKMKTVLCSEVQVFEMEKCHLEELKKIEKNNLERAVQDLKCNAIKLNKILNVSADPEKDEWMTLKEQIEETLKQLKIENMTVLQVLFEEEDKLTEEILTMGQWFEDWDTTLSRDSKRKILKSLGNSKTATNRNLCKEVVEFENFLLEHGGHEGGWDAKDHQLYLLLRKKYKPSCFISEASKKLYARTEAEIIEHEKWYQQYLEKREKKSIAVRKWKVEKQEEEKRKLEHRKELARLRHKQAINDKTKQSKEKQERLTSLLEWKNTKERLKIEEERKRQNQQKKEKEEMERRILLRDEMHKRQLEYRREKKRLEEELQELRKRVRAREREERAREAKEKIIHFQEKDKTLLKAKQERERIAKDEKQKLEKRLELIKKKVHFIVDRDPNRLQQLTASWKERAKNIGPSGMGRQIHLPRRIIPEWRRALY